MDDEFHASNSKESNNTLAASARWNNDWDGQLNFVCKYQLFNSISNPRLHQFNQNPKVSLCLNFNKDLKEKMLLLHSL